MRLYLTHLVEEDLVAACAFWTETSSAESHYIKGSTSWKQRSTLAKQTDLDQENERLQARMWVEDEQKLGGKNSMFCERKIPQALLGMNCRKPDELFGNRAALSCGRPPAFQYYCFPATPDLQSASASLKPHTGLSCPATRRWS
jgi:hypothetical protein